MMRDSMIKPPAFSRFTLVPFWLLGVLLLLTAVVLWFAVYIVITVLFCPLLLATRGRQIHGACNNFALLPVKLVSKYTRFLQWRASLLEFERGKPAPYPEGRRGLSLVPNQAKAQSESSFFAKLPLELRLQIYKEFIVGESKHLHVVVHRTARIRGYNCSHAFDSLVAGTQDCHAITTDDSEVIYAAYGVAARKYFSLTEVNKRCRGALSLTRTCKKAYLETIDLLYGLQTFSFPSLALPPFFMHSVLPEHLSRIKRIQICYSQITMSCYCQNITATTRKARHVHRVQRCVYCNLCSWSALINQHMTGLQTIEAIIYIDDEFRMPNVGEAWITWLFKFQQGANGLRDLKFQLLPGPWMSPSHPQETYAANAARLNTLLEDMLKQGTEEFQQRVLGNKQ